MLPRERVKLVLDHKTPDRTPIYAWLINADFAPKLIDAYGSIEAFEDKYEFDLAKVFPNGSFWNAEWAAQVRQDGTELTPEVALEAPFNDPDNPDIYASLRTAIPEHKEKRGRWIHVWTPGPFEATNGIFGIENHLMYMALYPEQCSQVYRRISQWSATYANNCIDLGADMVHISDDWGQQDGLMFNPRAWWDLVMPNTKIIADAVKTRGCYLSLHSDGNVTDVLDGIVELGFDALHPVQESAGMNLAELKANWGDKLTVYGGLDVQTTIGFGDYARLEAEITRNMRLFADGGLLFCTTHMVQPHCTVEELEFAYDLAYRLARELRHP